MGFLPSSVAAESQVFNTAFSPATVGPGNNPVILGNNSAPDSNTSGNLDRVYVNAYTVSGGPIRVKTLHVNCSGSGAFRLVVYDSTGPSAGPGALVCKTADLAGTGISPPTYADVSGAVTPVDPILSNSTVYWIGLHFGSNLLVLGKISPSTMTLDFQIGATFAAGPPNPFTLTPNTLSTSPHCFWVAGEQ